MKLLWATVLSVILLFPVYSFAGPDVYPIKEVIGFDAKGLPEKAPLFADWVKEQGLPGLSGEFIAAMKKEFGAVAVDNIDSKNKNTVLVASLHLVRASQYTVPKKLSNCIEYQLPITLSLVFTNPNTGDVVYAFTDTSYATAEIHESESPAQCDVLLRKATADNYYKLLDILVQKAKNNYNPALIEASVVKIWKGLYILNKGSKVGIGRNDNLTDAAGNLIQVNYVAEDYSVATPVLAENISEGAKFSKYASQSIIATIKKPKVLSMHEGWIDPQLQAVAGFFESELSKESAFTMLPVQESFSKMLGSLARETNLGQFQVTNQRALPGYFIKFGYAAPRMYEVEQKGKFGYRVYEQYVLGELLDKQGRIIYSAVGNDKIEDKNVAGMVFSKEARLEILLKNATKKLAEKFSQSIKFSHFSIPVTNVEGDVIKMIDTARQLRQGNSIQIYRNLGKVESISSEVLVPIWQANVVDATNGQVQASLSLPVSDEVKGVKVKPEDLVIVDAISAGSSAGSNTSVTYCKEGSPKLGDLENPDFQIISKGAGYLLPYSLFDDDADFLNKLEVAIREGGFKQSSMKLGSANTNGRCLFPVYKAGIEKRECEGENCEVALKLAAGFRLYVGKEKKGGVASETKVNVTQVREMAFDPIIQGELSKNILNLLEMNIAKVRFQ
ncbi:hypothetical protein [Geotalea sp. SG265]|uniref:hypothetical protein n=1 Tax=Geotalea sp. SG265 TaxID=2922867 RepID=UPI001FAFE1A8|nr:hypothetical protein [Geotalea sp. SG265]